MRPDRLREVLRTSNDPYALYLGLATELHDHCGDLVRALLGPATHDFYQEEAFQHPLVLAEGLVFDLLSSAARAIGGGFDADRDILLDRLDAAGGFEQAPWDAESMAAAVALRLLHRLDGIVAGALENSLNAPMYPQDTSDATIVLRRRPYHPVSEEALLLKEPGSLRTVLAAVLRQTYFVPRRTGDRVPWALRRVPEILDVIWARQARHRVLLIAFPHRAENLDVRFVDLAGGLSGFCVNGLAESADEIIGDVERCIEARLREDEWAIVMLPELTETPELRSRLRSILARYGNRVGLLLPGSAHQGSPLVRNQLRAIYSDGREGEDAPVHNKLTRFPLTASRTPEALRPEIEARGGHVLEAIATEFTPLTIWDSGEIGRFVVLICRDLLEAPLQESLRQHRSLDHVFVVAMSPVLDDFVQQGTDVAFLLGAGLYVINAPLWTVAGSETRHVAVGYRPVSGAHRHALRTCDGGHHVCDQVFDLRDGWVLGN